MKQRAGSGSIVAENSVSFSDLVKDCELFLLRYRLHGSLSSTLLRNGMEHLFFWFDLVKDLDFLSS